jgi:hypothetical protein
MQLKIAKKNRLLTITILFSLTISSVEIGSAGVRADLTLPNQGIRITEGFLSGLSVPVLMSGNSGNSPVQLICSSIYDETCTKSSFIRAAAHLPPCDDLIKSNCISAVYALNELGEKIFGKFVKFVAEQGLTDFSASEVNNLPQGKGQGGIWQIAGVNHSGGNDNYFVASLIQSDLVKSPGERVANQRFKGGRFQALIGPVNEQSGAYSPRYALDSRNPARDGSASGGIGIGSNSQALDRDKCFVFGVGTCQMPQSFPPDTRFGVSIILGEKLRGWFHGRIYKPEIKITNYQNGSQLINIEAEPVKVPTIEKSIPTSQISEDLRKYLSQDQQFSEGGGYLMPGSSGQNAFDQAKLWIPLLNDRATTSQTVWTVRTLDYFQTNDVQNCSAENSQLSGVVTTNSLVYSAGPPAYNQQTQTLDYQLTSPHLNADGTEAIGSYDLVLKSEVARCIYGFSNAPIRASISIVGASGENKVATTIVNEKNGWLYLSANGFTYSSPLIKVKLTQAKNQKYSISCVKGKATKKVTGTKPKCPAGFKIKTN